MPDQYARFRWPGRSWAGCEEEEPDTYDIFLGRGRGARTPPPENRTKYDRLRKSVKRIRNHFNRDMCELGKACTICGGHFKPARIDRVRCPDCIRRGKEPAHA